MDKCYNILYVWFISCFPQCMHAQRIIITKAKCLVALERMSHNIKFPNKRKYLVYLWFYAS